MKKTILKISIIAIASLYITSCDSTNNQTVLKQQNELNTNEPIAVAKEFVEAIANDDRAKVEEITGHSRSLIKFIYDDKQALQRAKRLIQTIDKNSWSQKPIVGNTVTEVKAYAYDSKIGKFPIVFEISKAERPGSDRKLYVSNFH